MSQSLPAWVVNALLVGSGGFLGSVLRYAVSGSVHRLLPQTSFAWGTFAVNIIGCALIGILIGLTETRQIFGPEFRTFAVIGLLGGFTTFSTFGYETIAMLRDGGHAFAIGNVLLHLALGLGAVWLGLIITTTGHTP